MNGCHTCNPEFPKLLQGPYPTLSVIPGLTRDPCVTYLYTPIPSRHGGTGSPPRPAKRDEFVNEGELGTNRIKGIPYNPLSIHIWSF